MSVLVIDIGTTGVRAAVMHPDAVLDDVCYRRVPPSTPSASARSSASKVLGGKSVMGERLFNLQNAVHIRG